MNHHANLSQQLNKKKNKPKKTATHEKIVGRVRIICIVFSLNCRHLLNRYPLIFIWISTSPPVRDLHSHLPGTHARTVRNSRAPSSGNVQSIAL